MNEKLIQFMNESFAATSWQRMQDHLRDPTTPWTLCHGDFHSSNMMLSRKARDSEDELILYDWSEVGPWEGTTDLAQMIISDVRMAVFRPHAQRLVRAYWDRLVQRGVNAREYSFEQCWKAFVRGGAERWAWMLCLLLAYPGLPAAAGQYFHDQVLAWLEEYQVYPCVSMKPVVCIVGCGA